MAILYLILFMTIGMLTGYSFEVPQRNYYGFKDVLYSILGPDLVGLTVAEE